MGKAPLRLILSRIPVSQNVWKETLECGHQIDAFVEFFWDGGKLVEFEPTAKRRRCQKCKPSVAPVLKTKAELTADQTRAALIHQQKLKFGTLFDKFCFANGELRPPENYAGTYTPKTQTTSDAPGCAGRVDEEPNADGTSRPAPYEFPSPKKPVQSETKLPKRRAA